MSSALRSAIPIISSIICIAWIPGAFVAAFFLAGKMGVNGGMRIFLTFILGGILLVAGVTAVVAGCATLVPLNFH